MSSVGVVVTAYDQGRTVEDAVLSVLAQSHPVDEVIVVDDGSTDPESLEVLAGLSALADLPRPGLPAAPVVRVLQQPNGGVSAARNTGIAASGTEVVAVLDGDDLWEPTFVEKTLALLADDSTVAASSWLSMFGVAQGVVEPTGGTVEAFLPRNAAPASALFWRAHWGEAGGYDESMRQGFEDWDFFLRLLRGQLR